VFAKLLGAAFGGKATVASGLLILASALVTGGAVSTDAAPESDETLAAPVEIAFSPAPQRATTRTPEPPRKADAPPSPSSPPATCVADAGARESALRTVRAAFATSQAALDRLGIERTGAKAAAALDHADTMLANVSRTAEDLVSKAGSCAADVREVSDRAVHAMEMIVDLARSATAPTPTPTPRPTFRKSEPTKKHR
jgi:hypothetical protein